jgi:hypothetical protein
MRLNLELNELGLPDLSDLGIQFDLSNFSFKANGTSYTWDELKAIIDQWVEEANATDEAPKAPEVAESAKAAPTQVPEPPIAPERKPQTTPFGDMSGAKLTMENWQKNATVIKQKLDEVQRQAKLKNPTTFEDFANLGNDLGEIFADLPTDVGDYHLDIQDFTEAFTEAFDAVDAVFKSPFEAFFDNQSNQVPTVTPTPSVAKPTVVKETTELEDYWADNDAKVAEQVLAQEPQAPEQNLIPAMFQVKDVGDSVPQLILNSKDYSAKVPDPYNPAVVGRQFFYNGELCSDMNTFLMHLLHQDAIK